MSERLLDDLPIHPRARAALPPEVWARILDEGEGCWRAPAPLGHDVEVLNWERSPERGVLHDPPERWYEVSREEYFLWRERWLQGREVPWPRVPAVLQAWAEHAAMKAYAVNVKGRGPVAMLLLWRIEEEALPGTPGPSLTLYVPDLVWDPEMGIRHAGRYLLQELYLRHPTAWAVVDFVPVTSPLNHVLMALGYRVYYRWFQKAESPDTC